MSIIIAIIVAYLLITYVVPGILSLLGIGVLNVADRHRLRQRQPPHSRA